MSMFSGKCDFYDSVVAIHCDGDTSKLEEFLQNTNIYVRGADGREHLIKCENEKDATKYYPYLTSIAAYDIKEGCNTIILSSHSFIDDEEKDIIGWYVEGAYKYWRKCKRNKKPFIVDECIESLHWMNDNILRIVAERVAKDGNKAEFDDLHRSLHEYYRRKWFEEMVRLGWDVCIAFNWCFNEFFPKKEVIEKRLGEELYAKYFEEVQ